MMEKLIELASNIKGVYTEIDSYRLEWDSSTKAIIQRTFKSVQKKIDLNLKIRNIDDIKNLESIRLTFGFLNSGLLIEPKKGKQTPPPMVLIKKGGYLSYTQMANGKINVFIHYPYIQDIYGDPERILEINMFNPKDIHKELILEHIELFLEEILKWEKEEKKLIGFHIGGIR